MHSDFILYRNTKNNNFNFIAITRTVHFVHLSVVDAMHEMGVLPSMHYLVESGWINYAKSTQQWYCTLCFMTSKVLRLQDKESSIVDRTEGAFRFLKCQSLYNPTNCLMPLRNSHLTQFRGSLIASCRHLAAWSIGQRSFRWKLSDIPFCDDNIW